MSAERRVSPRVTVDLWVDEQTDDALYFQRATSLSLGGLFLDRTLPHPAGTRVTLQLKLPGEGVPMQVSGEVVPSGRRAEGMGVRFVDLTTEQRARIVNFLTRDNSRSPRMFGPS